MKDGQMITQKPWGHEERFTDSDAPYTGKILHIKAGEELSLQRHPFKDETMYLWSGRYRLYRSLHNGDTCAIDTMMIRGVGYRIPPGMIHRVRAISDTVIFEVATPGDDIERLEDRYGRA